MTGSSLLYSVYLAPYHQVQNAGASYAVPARLLDGANIVFHHCVDGGCRVCSSIKPIWSSRVGVAMAACQSTAGLGWTTPSSKGDVYGPTAPPSRAWPLQASMTPRTATGCVHDPAPASSQVSAQYSGKQPTQDQLIIQFFGKAGIDIGPKLSGIGSEKFVAACVHCLRLISAESRPELSGRQWSAKLPKEIGARLTACNNVVSAINALGFEGESGDSRGTGRPFAVENLLYPTEAMARRVFQFLINGHRLSKTERSALQHRHNVPRPPREAHHEGAPSGATDKARAGTQCTTCGVQCKLGSPFCYQCGSELPAYEPELPPACTKCGTRAHYNEALYCTECAAPLSTAFARSAKAAKAARAEAWAQPRRRPQSSNAGASSAGGSPRRPASPIPPGGVGGAADGGATPRSAEMRSPDATEWWKLRHAVHAASAFGRAGRQAAEERRAAERPLAIGAPCSHCFAELQPLHAAFCCQCGSALPQTHDEPDPMPPCISCGADDHPAGSRYCSDCGWPLESFSPTASCTHTDSCASATRLVPRRPASTNRGAVSSPRVVRGRLQIIATQPKWICSEREWHWPLDYACSNEKGSTLVVPHAIASIDFDR